MKLNGVDCRTNEYETNTKRIRNDNLLPMKNKILTVRLDAELHEKAHNHAKKSGLKLAEFVRQTIATTCNTNEYEANTSPRDQQIEKLLTTVEGLQRALDQSQQLHAMSEKRHEAELAKIERRGFLQRLKAVFITN